MKLIASEFIDKAEGLKTSELSVRQRLERIQLERASVKNDISELESYLHSLYRQQDRLECSDSEEGDNSAKLASIESKISATYKELDASREREAELQAEEAEATAELHAIEQEEQATIDDIQDSASRTNQNIALFSSISGDYANISEAAASSFQANLAQLSQAAQILGSNISMGSAGSGGSSRSKASGRAAALSAACGNSRNFYEAANNQRKSGGMGAKKNENSLLNEGNASPYSSDKTLFSKQAGNMKKQTINQILDKPGINIHTYENSEEKQNLINCVAREWSSSLSKEEYSAVRDYTKEIPPYYKNINKKLRGKALFFDKGNKERASLIHSALEKSKVPCDCTVYRGASIDALGKYKDLSDEELIGKVLLDKGFMSTCTKKGKEFGGAVKLEIFVPAGSKGAYLSNGISAVGDGEYEMLFDKGSRLKVVGVSYDNIQHRRVIQVRMM